MIKRKIVEIHSRADKRYGVLKMKIKLVQDGTKIGTSRVTRLLNEMNLPQMSTKMKLKVSFTRDKFLPVINT